MSDPNPTPVKKFSFGRPGGSPVVAPTPAAPPATSAAAPAQPTVTNEGPVKQHPAHEAANLPAVQTPYQPPAFYSGDDETPVDAGDVRLPRLNIVQKSSGQELLAHGFGSLVLKGSVKLPLPVRLVVAGIRPKIWIEKVKFGTQGRIARSIDEVVAAGGTDLWRYSKENTKADSNRPWFMPSVTALVLIERPEGLSEDHFPFEANGKLYAAALTSVKSTNYEAFFGAIQSEKVTGVLQKGYNTRFISTNVIIKPFSGGESGVFKLTFGEETSPELRALANQVIGK